jgi:prevent-host-death family protein
MTKPAITVGVHEAKTRLSELLRAVAAGQEVEIRRSGRPIARIVPLARGEARSLGLDAGRFTVPEGFNDPLPADVEAQFYG